MTVAPAVADNAEAKSSSLIDNWSNIHSAPARFVHPERIVSCFDKIISSQLAKRLQASDRVQEQLKILLMDHFDLPDPSSLTEIDQVDLGLLSKPAEYIAGLVPLAGAIFWANIFTAEIRTDKIAAMKRSIGESAFQIALANRDLASGLPGPDDLDAAIERDGNNCLLSWHITLPSAVRAWAQLKHADDTFLSVHTNVKDQGRGVAIIRRLASQYPQH